MGFWEESDIDDVRLVRTIDRVTPQTGKRGTENLYGFELNGEPYHMLISYGWSQKAKGIIQLSIYSVGEDEHAGAFSEA